jgi:hypothetical protein
LGPVFTGDCRDALHGLADNTRSLHHARRRALKVRAN